MKRSTINIATIAFAILFLTFGLRAQDTQFTQYYQVPGQINPALTGTFGGLFRVGFNYRNQWKPAIQTPYSSSAASGDVKFLLGNKRSGQDIAALGIMFLSDRVKIIDHNTAGIFLTGAYHKALNEQTKQYIGGGVQIGIYQSNINYEDFTFEDQFNAIDAYNGLTAENLPVNNFGAFDMNLGINYSIRPEKRTEFVVGASLYHALAGNNSYFEKEEIPDNSLDLDFTRKRRINAHVSYTFPASVKVLLNPRAMYSKQGSHQQMILTNIFKFRNPQDDSRQLFIGPSLRLKQDIEGFGIESIILQTGIEYNGLILGLSYDYNVEDLLNTQKGLGIFEISINFLGEYENEDTFCPTF